MAAGDFSLPAVKDALLALLAARPGLGGVECAWAAHSRMKPEAVFFSSREEGTQVALVLGNQRRDESYPLDVVCSVSKTGRETKATAKAAELRAWALADEVARAVREDSTLGGSCLVAQVAEAELQTYAGPQESLAEVTVTVAVKART